MSLRSVGGIGFLIFIGFSLTVLAVFLKGWILVDMNIGVASINKYIGLIPYHSYNSTWFQTVSWLMFISFGFYFLIFPVYYFAVIKVRHYGCSHSIRHHFHLISSIAFIITIMEMIAFVITLINCSDLSFDFPGYATYLALASSLVTLGVGCLSLHAAKLVKPGSFITFYPLPNLNEPIPARICLTVAQRIDQDEVKFMELAYDDSGWCLAEMEKPRPSFDTLNQLLEFYSTYSSLEVFPNTGKLTDSQNETTFE